MNAQEAILLKGAVLKLRGRQRIRARVLMGAGLTAKLHSSRVEFRKNFRMEREFLKVGKRRGNPRSGSRARVSYTNVRLAKDFGG
jgi:hypothetical protein